MPQSGFYLHRRRAKASRLTCVAFRGRCDFDRSDVISKGRLVQLQFDRRSGFRANVF